VAVKDAGAAGRIKAGSERLLEVLSSTPVEDFVPEGESGPEPALVTEMVGALELDGHENVLEVGTGFGWRTALLTKLARQVWSVELEHVAAQAAAGALTRHGATGVRVIVTDGARGLPARAPYDAILVGPDFPTVPAALTRQLAPGGRLVQRLGDELAVFERAGAGPERVR
jgi:protein-L-isoaspartate(D-aspartate) O-methyltransferase